LAYLSTHLFIFFIYLSNSLFVYLTASLFVCSRAHTCARLRSNNGSMQINLTARDKN